MQSTPVTLSTIPTTAVAHGVWFRELAAVSHATNQPLPDLPAGAIYNEAFFRKTLSVFLAYSPAQIETAVEHVRARCWSRGAARDHLYLLVRSLAPSPGATELYCEVVEDPGMPETFWDFVEALMERLAYRRSAAIAAASLQLTLLEAA